MDKDKIKNFITTQRSNGISDAEIYSFLKQKGVDFQAQQTTTQPTEQKRPFWQRATEFAADITGGKEIAQGLGQALNLKNAKQTLDTALENAITQQNELLQQRQQIKSQGGDTTAIDKALQMSADNLKIIGEGADALLNPNELTSKQVIGDALQLATTVSAGKIGGAIAKGLAPAKQAVTFGQGAIQGAKVGAVSGGVLGTSYGAATGLQEDRDLAGVAKSAVKGGVLGAGTGAVVGGLVGGVQGKITGKKILKDTVKGHIDTVKENISQATDSVAKNRLIQDNKIDLQRQLREQGLTKQADLLDRTKLAFMDNADDYANAIDDIINNPDKVTQRAYNAITPDTKNITGKEYEMLVEQGRIQPRKGAQPPKYVLSSKEREIAEKYNHLLQNKDPIKNIDNLSKQLSVVDKRVDSFLRDNNGIYNTGELKNFIVNKLDDIDDITVPQDRLDRGKQKLIDGFFKSLDKNDMHTLWRARKQYDQTIEKAFSGSPTLQKELKKGFRNAIQQFISERTPNNTYSSYMSEMSGIYDVKDLLENKAVTEKGLNALQVWARNHPTRAKIVYGVAGTGAGAYILDRLFRK